MPRNTLDAPFNPLAECYSEPGSPYTKQLMRAQVVEILRSYHQTYDHLQELIQNSVDACEDAYDLYVSAGRRDSFLPKIKVLFNLDNNSVAVSDNGLGMDVETVRKYYFTPFAGKKRGLIGVTRRRGEKGVGATFLSYGSKSIWVSSRPYGSTDVVSCKMEGGIEWVRDASGSTTFPLVHPATLHPDLQALEHGTVIVIELNNLTNLKNLARHGNTPESWEGILRLFTSIGYIKIGEEGQDPTEFLRALNVETSVLREGRTNSKVVDLGYLYPHTISGATSIQLPKIKRKTGRPTAASRMKDLIYKWYGETELSELLNRKLQEPRYTRFAANQSELQTAITTYKPRAYVAFVWANEFWENANKKVFRTRREEIRHGIVFATRTHKVGEAIRINFGYRTGDYNRFIVVLDMDDIPPDIGRKSVPQEITDLAQLVSDTVHDLFVDARDCLRPTPLYGQAVVAVRLDDIKANATSNGSPLDAASTLGLSLKKEPREEQDVIAMFFELIGKNHLRGYNIYATKISEQYDAVTEFQLASEPRHYYGCPHNKLGIPQERFEEMGGSVRSPRAQFLEFKLNSDDLIRDVRHEEKKLSDIHWLVCWDIGSRHEREGIDIIDVTEPSQCNHRAYYGITHLMRDDTGTEVHVIALRKVLECLTNHPV